jgi:hypothetical protein
VGIFHRSLHVTQYRLKDRRCQRRGESLGGIDFYSTLERFKPQRLSCGT